MRKNIALCEVPTSDISSPLETEAMRQITLHAVAHTLGRSYPTLVTTPRGLSRAWRQGHAKRALREGAADLIREFMGIGCRLSTTEDIDAFSSHCIDQLKAKSLCVLRTYVSLTEAYNFLATGSFLTNREWLCPWNRWDMYLYSPLWEEEDAFVRVLGALEGAHRIDVYNELVVSPPAYVGNTVAEIADAAEANSISPPPAAGPEVATWLESVAVRVRRDYSLRGQQADLVAVLRYYVISGRLLLWRRWWGYQLASASRG